MLLGAVHPIQTKRGRNIMQVRQPLHPSSLLRHWNFAKTAKRHAKPAPNQPARQLARIRPDSVHRVGRNQYVHKIAWGAALVPLLRELPDSHSISDAQFPEVISRPCNQLHNFCRSLHIRYNLGMFRLMCITAHPDDEAGNFGGILSVYRDRGAETSVICLTPGQAATNRGGAKSDRELADIRRQEFAASCAILRV